MGAGLCKRPKDVEEGLSDEQQRASQLAHNFSPLEPTEAQEFFELPPHILILGPQSVGKTTLFLRLKAPEVSVDNLDVILTPTGTFHMEPCQVGSRMCFLWDVSGDWDMMRGHLDAFENVFVRGIIWVVNMMDWRETEITLARGWMEEILGNTAFQTAFFFLLFNDWGNYADESGLALNANGEQALKNLQRFYNVAGFQALHYPRFGCGVTNIRAGKEDPRWGKVAEWINLYLTAA